MHRLQYSFYKVSKACIHIRECICQSDSLILLGERGRSKGGKERGLLETITTHPKLLLINEPYLYVILSWIDFKILAAACTATEAGWGTALITFEVSNF